MRETADRRKVSGDKLRIRPSIGAAMENCESDEVNYQFRSPLEVYRRLVDLVTNESSSPELLPFEETVVDCIVDQIEHMRQTIDRLGSKLDPFCREQHCLELERFSFVVNKYLRTRIEKIERNVESLLQLILSDRQKVMKMMSRLEIKYVDDYVSSLDGYFKEVLLEKMPKNTRSFRIMDIPSDNQSLDNQYVFVKALNDISIVVDDPLTGEEVVEMKANGQHFLPYSVIRHHMQNGSKDLLIL